MDVERALELEELLQMVEEKWSERSREGHEFTLKFFGDPKGKIRRDVAPNGESWCACHEEGGDYLYWGRSPEETLRKLIEAVEKGA